MKVKRGDIIYLRKDSYESMMGAGNLQYGVRPLLVISNDAGNKFSNICIVAPLTRKNKRLPTHYKTKTNSIVMCEQIFTINQSDVERIVVTLDKKEMAEIEKCLKVSLGFERG